MRNSPKRSAAKLVKYMGTREGVEKVSQGFDRSPVTVHQQRLINSITKKEKRLAEYPEYQTYCNEPCKGSATEFIDAYMERNADRISDSKIFVNYMAQRPGVEKLGSHGLFSQTDDAINLEKVSQEAGQHPGIIWTHVISLRREDAERLGYNKADTWKKLLRRNALALAEAQNIKPVSRSVKGIFKLLCQLAAASYERKQAQLHSQTDRKLLSKIQQKKIAHGIRIEPRYADEEQYYGGPTMSM